jgi:hypothetical protein
VQAPGLADQTPAWLSYFDDEEAEAVVSASSAVPHEWQFHSEQMRAWNSPRRIKVVVAGRRGGKSELKVRWQLAGAMDDHLKGVAGVSWVVTPTLGMARPLWAKFQRLAPPGWITNISGGYRMPDYIEVGKSRIEFKSADRPERLVGEGLRRLSIDEAGIVKAAVWQESLMPALMDHRAPVLLTGTPKGRNWLHNLFLVGLDPIRGPQEDVGTFIWPSTANPFIPGIGEEVERLRKTMPERLFRQEILAHFLQNEGAVFDGHRAIVGAVSGERTVAFGCDLARKTDYTVVIGLDRLKRMTEFHRWQKIPWPDQRRKLILLDERVRSLGGRRPRWSVDATGAGDPVAQDLALAGLAVDPFIFTAQSKGDLIEALAMEIEQAAVGVGTMRLSDEPVLLNELDIFEYATTAAGHVRYSAPEDMHDDTVCALALANRAASLRGDLGVTIGEAEERASRTEVREVQLVENPAWADPSEWK